MTDPNDLTFPVHVPASDYGQELPHTHNGLTKREYFAGIALTGLLGSITLGPLPVIAKVQMAVECADELIKKLNEQ